jgi:hypothetical protein
MQSDNGSERKSKDKISEIHTINKMYKNMSIDHLCS